MMDREYVILYNELFRREIIPGSENEYRVVDKLKNLFREVVDWVKVVNIPTDSWFEEECIVETSDYAFSCRVLPYVGKDVVEGNFVEAKLVEDKIVLLDTVEYPIVFIEFPEELDITKYILLELYRLGAIAVVFYDKYSGRYRRSVVNGDENYSFKHGSPPPIPAVSIDREDYLKLKNRRVKRILLRINARVVHGLESKIVLAGINGSGRGEIHVSAHHDHWFTGFSDNLVGVESLYQLTKNLRGWRGLDIVLISYSSEEIGAPNYTSWYWAWGSRYFINILDSKNELEHVVADINIDAIYRTPLEIHGNPSLKKCIEGVVQKYGVKYRGYDHMDFDSFSYTLHGVPALTINSLESIDPIYHSNHDDGSDFDPRLLDTVIHVVEELVQCIDRERPSYKYLVEHVKKTLGDNVPLEVKVLVSKLESLREKIVDEHERIRFTTKLFTDTTYIPGLQLEYSTNILGSLIHMKEIIEKIDKYVGRVVKVKNYDEDLLYITPTKHNLEELKKSITSYLSLRARELDKLLTRELVYKLMDMDKG